MNNVYIVTMNFPMTKSFQSMVHFNHTVRCSPRFQKLTYMPDQHVHQRFNDQFDLIYLEIMWGYLKKIYLIILIV